MEEDISALRNLVNLDSDIVNDLDFDGHNALSLSILEEKYFAAKILIFSKVIKAKKYIVYYYFVLILG